MPSASAQTGQPSGSRLTNQDERRVLQAAYENSGNVSWTFIKTHVFQRAGAQSGTRTKNALRKPVREGWLRKLGPGDYVLTAQGLDILECAWGYLSDAKPSEKKIDESSGQSALAEIPLENTETPRETLEDPMATTTEERIKRDTLRMVFKRLASGKAFSRPDLYQGISPLLESKIEWQRVMLRRMAAIGLIENCGGLRQATRWRLAAGRSVDIYLKQPDAVMAILRPSTAVAQAEEDNGDDPETTQEPPALSVEEECPVTAEPAQAAPEMPSPSLAPDATGEAVQASLLKLSYAMIQNMIYMREKVDRMEKTVNELLALWTK